MLHYTPLIIFLTCLSCFHVHAQHRYVVVDMETGVPQRDVRVRWDRNHETHTIWDGSFTVDSVRDSLEIFKYGYMTRKMKTKELTDTIGILPTFNKLSEVVIYGIYKPRKFGWTLKPITKEEIAAMNCKRLGVNVDVIGGIKKLFTRKKRKRQRQMQKTLAEY